MSLMKPHQLGALVLVTFAIVVAGCDRDASKKPQAEQPKPATQPIIPITQIADWCPEHSMPESICVQCNSSLAAAYKEKGDWDAQHNLPKSQCFKCDPALKDKFVAAYKAKYGKEPPTAEKEIK